MPGATQTPSAVPAPKRSASPASRHTLPSSSVAPASCLARPAVASTTCPSGVRRPKRLRPRLPWFRLDPRRKGRCSDVPWLFASLDVRFGKLSSLTLEPRFFDRRTGERWLAAKVAEICRGNLAEWMAPAAQRVSEPPHEQARRTVTFVTSCKRREDILQAVRVGAVAERVA